MIEYRIFNNIIHLSGAANTSSGIFLQQAGCEVSHNSIWSDAGSGSGIETATGIRHSLVANNLIEGFSAVGGFGIEFHATDSSCAVYGGNSVNDCETPFQDPSIHVLSDGGAANEILGASPFVSASIGDFSPVDTGAVKEGAVPQDFGGQ